MKYFIGIDIGSTCAKTIVMDGDKNIVHRLLQPTGWSSVDTAQAIHDKLEEMGIPMKEATVVATGYGRISVPYADKCVTEITCHGRGTCFVYGTNDLTVIDIGGQDTKLISVENGMVKDFIMNDKCSAGTGRFLEVMANTLGLRPDALCELAAQGGNTSISSMCTVFAESEVISLIGRGEPKENIAFAVWIPLSRKSLPRQAVCPWEKPCASPAACASLIICARAWGRSWMLRCTQIPMAVTPVLLAQHSAL